MNFQSKRSPKKLAKHLSLCGLVGGLLVCGSSSVYAGGSEIYFSSSSSNGDGSVEAAKPVHAANTTMTEIIDLGSNSLAPDTGLDTGDEGDGSPETAEAPEASTGFTPFFNLGYGSLTTDTGKGEVKSDAWGADLGLAKTLDQSSGKLAFAPIIDYGKSSFDSYAENGTFLGKGETEYLAGGFMARKTLDNGFYYEGSLRYGRTQMQFNDMNGAETYDDSAPCWAAHITMGRNLKIGRRNNLHIYGMYHHAHQDGIDVPDQGSFDAVDNGRFRVGARITRYNKKRQAFYTGLAYQYEYTGAADFNSTWGGKVEGDSNNGSSLMLELGWQVKPMKNSPWMVDVNCTGWVGMQRGITATAKLKKAF
ncbi:MAG: autotransporter outer membrane beta-barrel domain-containing protein [Selenomonadaceae bacterium]|nr:autotransporter outer membrane beta-barrel domain-containing protein [Selenomonadaceae bacterium]